MAFPNICLIPGCVKYTHARDLCVAHYRKLMRHGDPLGGHFTCGDGLAYLQDIILSYDGDACLIWPFATNSKGYAMMRMHGKMQLVTRIVCKQVYGPPPTTEHEAAHSCGRGASGCVAKDHLRWATPDENRADRWSL
ncbi:MAG: hypothetical protein AAAC47_14080 [Pararhizobium sp.]|jgi:hypothetical protein